MSALALLVYLLICGLVLGAVWLLVDAISHAGEETEACPEAVAKATRVQPRVASPVRRVDQPAPEPWQTAEDLIQDARGQVDRDVDSLHAQVNSMMGALQREQNQP